MDRDDLVKEMETNGFRLDAEHTFLPYQYFLVFKSKCRIRPHRRLNKYKTAAQPLGIQLGGSSNSRPYLTAISRK